ncbi:hypothetical protein EMCRGX_G034330 [Ephydatia muelleri]
MVAFLAARACITVYLKCADATLEYNQTCEVPYLDTVTLHCPEDGNSSSWFKLAGRSVLVCNHSVCSLAEVTQWSTGLYYCRTFTMVSGEEVRDYFVNLIVLAPPVLLKVAICTTPDTCRAPQPSVLWRDRQLKISVFFKGTGSFNVSWSKQRDDGTRAPFNCSAYFPPNHCVLDVLENQQTITLFNNPFQPDDEGIYIANVTNEFGYNTSSTSIAIRCNAVPPRTPARVDPQQVSLTRGAAGNITCSAEMDSTTSLIACYKGSQGDTEYCSTCQAYTTGSCSLIKTKPEWRIQSAVSYPYGQCKPQREVRITVSRVETDDAGTVSCYWLASAAEGRVLYATQVIVVD